MQNKKQNNPTSWKDRLEDPDYFSKEEKLEKNAAWNQLEERLGHKRKRTKILWYWPAAACLVIAVSLAFFIFSKNNTPFQKAVFKENNYSTDTKMNSSIFENKNGENKLIIKSEEGISYSNIQKRKKPPYGKIIENNILTIDTSFKENPAMEKNIAINITKPEAIVFPIANNINTVKKKMRVVHINELDEPPQELAKTSNKPSFLGSPLINNNQANSNNNKDYSSIFKIKISSN